MSNQLPLGLQDYLEQSGVLETGDAAAIEAVKQQYKRDYQAAYRRARRKSHPQTTVTLDQDQWETLSEAAQRHHLSLPAFLRKAALAYLNQSYVVPDKRVIARLEQIISLMRTDTQIMARHISKQGYEDLAKLYPSLMERLIRLERQVSAALRQPPKHDC